MIFFLLTKHYQSIENASVAFVKKASERNELFEKNKQTGMYDEQVRTNKAEDYLSQGRTDMGMNSGDNRLVYHCTNRTI